MTRERNADLAQELDRELALAHRRMNQLSYPQPHKEPMTIESSTASYTHELRELADAILNAFSQCDEEHWSFPDLLREAFQEVAAYVGDEQELVRSRPGSWEADHIRRLASLWEIAGDVLGRRAGYDASMAATHAQCYFEDLAGVRDALAEDDPQRIEMEPRAMTAWYEWQRLEAIEYGVDPQRWLDAIDRGESPYTA